MIPWILPETQFVRYINEEDVKKILEKYGAEITEVTYHQNPAHKKLGKLLDKVEDAQDLLKELFLWEFKISKYLGVLSQSEREKLFPAICLWSRKK